MNPKASISKKKAKKVSTKGTCYHYGKEGHWRRNCKEYLAAVKQANVAKDLYMIQTNLLLSTSISDSWVLDTACGSYFCKSLQDLQKIKSLNKGDFELFDASGESIQVEAVETKILKLPSDKVLKLKIYYYIPDIVRNIIYILLLLEQNFEIIIKKNGCTIYFFNEFYGSIFIDNGLIFFLLNDNIFHIDNMKKRKREDMNVTYFWHCRLGHIN